MPDDDMYLDDDAQEEDTQQFFGQKAEVLQNQLKKLHEHGRSNVQAEMAQKGSFDVRSEPGVAATQPPAADTTVSLLVYPQDPFNSDPKVRELSAGEVMPGLMNSRVRVRDSRYPAAQPDADNNYLYWVDTPEFSQVNAFYYTALTLRMYEKFAQRKIPWAFGAPRLYIDTHVGNGKNAFYDEQNRTLGFFAFESDGQTVNTAHSADVVSHEAAHAILDGVRDLYNESFGLGPVSFHESFGDMSALLVALHDDELIHRLLEWTKGDLRVDSFLTQVAERIIEKAAESDIDAQEVNERTIYLRNAVNHFRYAPFDELPYFADDPRYELGRESHNYSRLFTGAFYDVFVALYEHFRDEQDVNPHVAVVRARERMGYMLAYAIELGPVGELTFADMALAFLTADKLLNDGLYSDMMIEAFANRQLIAPRQARDHLDQLDRLPEIVLPEYVDSQLEAGIFLLEDVLPVLGYPRSVEYTPMSAHRNRAGYAFLTYFSAQKILLVGEDYGQFEGTEIDAFGGITLAFDPDGKLCSAVYRPVTTEDVRQIQLMTVELIRHGLVTSTTDSGRSEVLSEEIVTQKTPSVLPRFLFLDDKFPGRLTERAKLVRIPMILDAVPHDMVGFLDYLQEWIKRRRA